MHDEPKRMVLSDTDVHERRRKLSRDIPSQSLLILRIHLTSLLQFRDQLLDILLAGFGVQVDDESVDHCCEGFLDVRMVGGRNVVQRILCWRRVCVIMVSFFADLHSLLTLERGRQWRQSRTLPESGLPLRRGAIVECWLCSFRVKSMLSFVVLSIFSANLIEMHMCIAARAAPRLEEQASDYV